MDKNLKKLHEVDSILAKLVDGGDLTTEEAEDLVYHIFVYDTYGMHFATFVGALHAKGETADELLGFLNATKKLAVKFDLGIDKNKVTDLSGTGGGKFKAFNVSTAASFVVAAAGYTVAKESYFAVTSPTGSADVFSAFGVDFLKLTKEQIEKALKIVGICPIIVPFISPKLKNRGILSRKFFVERQVRVRTLFHLASNIFSPVSMNHRIYGCYSEKYLDVIADLFWKLGFERTLVFYADIGLPEISNVGKTTVVEQNGNNIKKYVVRPKDIGVIEANEEEIKTGGREQNIIDFVNILKGRESRSKRDLVAINTGASLYSLGDVKGIAEGTKKAQHILNSGEGYRKLEQLINMIGSPNALNKYN
jgi:anthranilate phosphoribosyltransferase